MNSRLPISILQSSPSLYQEIGRYIREKPFFDTFSLFQLLAVSLLPALAAVGAIFAWQWCQRKLQTRRSQRRLLRELAKLHRLSFWQLSTLYHLASVAMVEHSAVLFVRPDLFDAATQTLQQRFADQPRRQKWIANRHRRIRRQIFGNAPR